MNNKSIKSSSPLVSIIVPNYNHEIFLEQRLNSIFQQRFQSFEVILLDDASKDHSVEILEEYAKRFSIKVSHTIFNENNSGSTFKQWKKGIELTEGKYIWIAESDDWAHTDFLEKTTAVLNDYPNVGLCYTQSWKVDNNGSILGSMTKWTDDIDPNRWKKDFINGGKDEFLNFFLIKNTIPNASAVLFRKSLVQDFDSTILSAKMSGDKMFWANLLMKSDIAFIAEHLNYFRLSDSSVRKSVSPKKIVTENLKWLNYIKVNYGLPDNQKVKAFKNPNIHWRNLIKKLPASKLFSVIPLLLQSFLVDWKLGLSYSRTLTRLLKGRITKRSS